MKIETRSIAGFLKRPDPACRAILLREYATGMPRQIGLLLRAESAFRGYIQEAAASEMGIDAIHAIARGDFSGAVLAPWPNRLRDGHMELLNPETIAMFIDAAVLGDGEEAALDISAAIRDWKADGQPGTLRPVPVYAELSSSAIVVSPGGEEVERLTIQIGRAHV